MSIHANPVRAAALAALVLAAATAATPQRARGDTVPGSFQRVQALADLVPGDYVVTGSKANSDDQYAMLHELGGSSTTYLLRHGDEPLTVAADAIADPDDSIVWSLEESELGWTLRNGGDYVAYKGSANSATFMGEAVSNAQWTVAESGTEGLFTVANAAKPARVLQYYTTANQERFACYTNFSRTQPLAFWRKTASGGLVPHAIAISPAIENGTLSTDPAGTATAGEQVEVTGLPDDGWRLAEVTVTGDSSALSWTYPTSGEPIGFPMPDEDVTLTARFEQDEGPGPGTGGIQIEGDATGTVDQEVTFTVIPEQEGASVYIQGFEPPADSTLTMDALTLDFPLVAFVPDAPGDYRFLFATDDATAEWTVTVTAGDDPGPGGDAIRFDGDSEGSVGEEAAFTATAASEDAQLYLTDFIPPQGSSLTMDAIGIDLPDVTFVPDVPGPYVFVFVAASPTAQASGEWTVTVLPAELRITSIDVQSGTVTLRYEGEAASVQGTHDLTAAPSSWATVPGSVLYPDTHSATLPASKPFLRLSSVPAIPEDYLVVDLSAGATTGQWPVEELHAAPCGGWSDEYKTTKLVLRKIPAGTFVMGSPDDELGHRTNEVLHKVTLTRPYYIGVFEVTQKQWELVTGTNTAYYASLGDMRPMDNASYADIRGAQLGAQWPQSADVDAGSFLGFLRARTGIAFDLPTEAQWEYACRAGTTTALNSGKNLSDKDSCPEMYEVGRCLGNWDDGKGGYDYSHTTVGSYRPNSWGLYDMHGNVLEWCLDWYGDYDVEAATDPVGPPSGEYRINRGAPFYAMDSRSANRASVLSTTEGYASAWGFMGFRLAAPAPETGGVQLWKNGPYWAETNIGADNPEDSGLYFWWGDTIGYRRENDAWVASDGSVTNYDFNRGNTLTYGMDNAKLQSEGWITEEGVLAPEHDAAQTHWGGDWRMPTDAELQALLDNCDWTWPTTVNGVDGYLVRGRGDYASKSIFLPAAGHGYGTSLEYAGWGEDVWSSVPNSGDYNSWGLHSYLADYGMGAHPRYYGFSVRPVRREPPTHDGVRLWEGGPEWAETNIGADTPADSGLYFWWGDTVGYRRENDAWVASDGSSTNYSFDFFPTPTVRMDTDALLSAGWITADGVLAPAHDAAQAHWGGDWRMPTKEELQALIDNCDWTSTTVDGVEGCEVRGRGNYGNASIFLPAAGYADEQEPPAFAGRYGYIWSSVPDSTSTDYSWFLDYDSIGNVWAYRARSEGLSVRPVR